MVSLNPTAFDAFAGTYDDDFTNSTLGQLLRSRVWEKLGQHFSAGQYILELTCGTVEDAIWLARRGVYVTATDGSAEMVKQAKAKTEAARREAEGQRGRGAGETNRAGSVEVKQVSLQEIIAGYFNHQTAISNIQYPKGTTSPIPNLQSPISNPFDGVFSNFGGLNTIGEWRSLAAALAEIVRPGGSVILVPMGPFCPWEILWYLAHGQPKQAFRRFLRKGAAAKIGQAMIPIWYPSARQLRADFSPWFQYRCTESLELWLPPTYLDHFVNRWPGFFQRLNEVEKATARLTGGWGDHYIIIFERKTAIDN